MFVSITRLRVRLWRYLPGFTRDALRSALQARSANGCIGVTVLADANRTFWTRTLWDDERAMRAFVMGGPHRVAMRDLPRWCDEAAIVHWTQSEPAAPSWLEARQRLQNEGRHSNVDRPSSGHENFRIAVPKAGLFRELRFK